MAELESDIEKRLVREIKRLGGIAYKFVSPGNAGVPDRVICFPGGSTWFVELKTETGKLTALQQTQIKRLRSLGQNVVVLYGRSQVDKFIYEIARPLCMAWKGIKREV